MATIIQTKLKYKSITQQEIAKTIAEQLGCSIEVVTQIIEAEQKITMQKVRDGFKVCKKNYLTLTPKNVSERTITSPLTNIAYKLPEHKTVRVSIGQGFKALLGGKQMKKRICRFVGEQNKES